VKFPGSSKGGGSGVSNGGTHGLVSRGCANQFNTLERHPFTRTNRLRKPHTIEFTAHLTACKRENAKK
jgi:hypothetical protein